MATLTFFIHCRKRSPWKRPTWILFTFLLIICLMMTANIAGNLATNTGLVRGAFLKNPQMPLSDRLQLADELVTGVRIAELWSGGNSGGGILVWHHQPKGVRTNLMKILIFFQFVFADAVVVWRACVLWPGNKIVKGCLSVLLLTGFGMSSVMLIIWQWLNHIVDQDRLSYLQH